ncbi:uncharacterized protein LOC126575547 isoform X2 [Anopheles aquasalis]|uniref:uncharacterized protein LOC126575547 isoform X2 n=1 Tax=Anopheles aquasalis TaxID=42839 RepID=UPI00215B2440|nr:uncharacterized protein LOC126575547 isoform X2 [Anopheles aquasalis]XP_050092249.1 uncharacterized protein LOC126575547 isoform X2 [Anopheles aquasalis]
MNVEEEVFRIQKNLGKMTSLSDGSRACVRRRRVGGKMTSLSDGSRACVRRRRVRETTHPGFCQAPAT